MLAKKERLNRVDFDRFFASGRRYHSPHMTLIYAQDASFRASAVAPKKVFRTAVERNKFRRRVYDIFRRMHVENPFVGIFICIAKSGATALPHRALKLELSALVEKTGALG